MSSNNNYDEDNAEALRKILPLIPEEVEYSSDRTAKYKALSNPADNNSVKYDFVIYHHEGNEGLRESIRFYLKVFKLQKACNFDASGLDQVITTITHGGAKTSYTQGRDAAQNEAHQTAIQAALDALDPDTTNNTRTRTRDGVPVPAITNDMIKAGLRKIIEDVAPYEVLPQVKRYLRRYCRKPSDLKFRQFVNHFTRINNEEIPMLPPFKNNQSLAADEVIEIYHHAIPNSWKREMKKQGFNPYKSTLVDFIEFCERHKDITFHPYPVHTTGMPVLSVVSLSWLCACIDW